MSKEEKYISPCGVFDTHAHYTDERFASEYEGGADAALKACFDSGVAGIINIGTTPESSRAAVEQAAGYPLMYAAAGIHPTEIGKCGDFDHEMAAIYSLLKERKKNKLVAVGEIGLDYYWKPYDKELQKKYLDAQMELAKELELPVMIHDREAHGDCFEAVLRHPGVRGVFHSYSGSAEMALELCKRGFYISFSGTVTFHNARGVRSVAEEVPDDRILVETDCPYLAPEPYRGRLNYSAYAAYTVNTIGEVKGMSFEDTAALTLKNAKNLFGIGDF